MNAHNLRLLAATLAAHVAFSSTALQAQTDDWTNGGNDSSWSNTANWSAGVPVAATQVVIATQPSVEPFYRSSTILEDTGNVSGDNIASLTFNSGLTPMQIALGTGVESLFVNGAINNQSASAVNFNLPMSAGKAVPGSVASVTYAGGISSTGTLTGGSLNFGFNLDLQGFAVTMTGIDTVMAVTSGPASSLLNDSIGGGTLTVGTAVTSGTVTLKGNNTFGTTNGATPLVGSAVTIVNGTLSVPTLAAVGTAQPLGLASTVTLAGASTSAPAILQYTGTTAATLAQNVTVSTGDVGTISNIGGNILTLGGTIRNGSGLSFTSGTFKLAGSMTGTGSTTVSGGGTLLVDSGSFTALGPVNVASTGALGGSGTIRASSVTSSAAVNVASGATLDQSAVSSDRGTSTLIVDLNPGEAVNLAQGSKYDFDLGASGVSDQVIVQDGAVDLNGQNFSDFTFTTLSGFTGTGTYDLIVTDTSGDLQGSLADTTGIIDGDLATLSVLNSEDLVLTIAAPEPSTWALLLGGFSLLTFWRVRQGRVN